MPLKKIVGKEKLLGRVKKPTPTGNHQPNVSRLQETAKIPEVKIPVFCRGCGYLIGLLPEGADYISIELPTDCRGLFVQVEECFRCGEDLKNSTLKKISDVK